MAGRLSRREFLAAAGAVGALGATGAWRSLARAATTTPLPAPLASGIDHIVVVCMENRSFDHFLGWVPNANGQQAGLSYPDDNGVLHPTHQLTDWTGCGFNDPDHSYAGGRVQYDNGACDGFRKGDNDDYALGYYTGDQLPTSSQLVSNFTVCDNYFCSILGPTYPNRFYTHAAATDRVSNTNTQSVLPTIWDELKSAGISANYYFSDLPFLALWAQKYVDIARPIGEFFVQAASDTLPAYTYLDPFFLGEDQGASNDDHPHADIRRGQSFLAKVVNALMQSRAWPNTVLVITYDEWGGFFEHVPPPTLPDNDPAHALAGFRVPTYVVSPFAPPGIASNQYDHSSILKMVEWRFGLHSLTPRDLAANNLAEVLDLSGTYTNPATSIPDVTDPGPHVCVGNNSVGLDSVSVGAPTGMGNSEPFWQDLKTSSLLRGWRALV